MEAQLEVWAHRLFVAAGDITIPVNVDKIARSLDVEVTLVEGPGPPAVLVRNQGCGATIYVRASDYVARRRFSVAHELGHFIFGSRDESIANGFAAAILMPRAVFISAWYDYDGEPSIWKVRLVASRLGVSAQAAMIRAEGLNLMTQWRRVGDCEINEG